MINADGTRREFFRTTVGRLVTEVAKRTEQRIVTERFFRPPGALDEVAFLAACTRCSECIDVCPASAIARAPTQSGLAAGTPVLYPSVEPCTVCDDIPCAAACPTDALTIPEHGWAGYTIARLELVPETCTPFHGDACSECVRTCPLGEVAITADAAGRPVIKAEGCVGCGVCVRACPTSPPSLKLHHPELR